ncbi:hypothetical protein D5086_006011 [Populus alba]|uniref:Uncharacterized protein n=1 Tax=Populus alba TaxID=43335 RepID=A0ACC4CJI8_POPAL
MIEDMDSNETEVCPIKKALEISVPSSLASQLNWAVESDSVSSQAMDDAASLNLILFPLMATLRTVVFLHVLREGSCGMSLAKQNLIS